MLQRLIHVELVPRELLTGNRQAFKSIILAQLEREADVIIDFQQAYYVDTSGIGVLVSLARRFREAGHQLVLCGLDPDLTSIFHLTRIDSLFNLHADVAAAQRALGADPE